MRRFEDPNGREWDVVVGRESWGALYALFIPTGEAASDDDVRQAPLDAESYTDAQVRLGELSEEQLDHLLERSTSKES